MLYVAFNSQGHIATGSLPVEETSAYCTVNHRASASNYQLSNMKGLARDSNRQPQRLEARTLTSTPPSPPVYFKLTNFGFWTCNLWAAVAVIYIFSHGYQKIAYQPHPRIQTCLSLGRFVYSLTCTFLNFTEGFTVHPERLWFTCTHFTGSEPSTCAYDLPSNLDQSAFQLPLQPLFALLLCMTLILLYNTLQPLLSLFTTVKCRALP